MEPITDLELKEWREWAASGDGSVSRLVIPLIDEVERLRKLVDNKNGANNSAAL